MAVSGARLRRAVHPGTLGVDVGGAVNLVGAIVKYLSLAFLLPLAVALGYREPFWPFLLAGLVTWMGRLELVPIAVLLTRAYWRA